MTAWHRQTKTLRPSKNQGKNLNNRNKGIAEIDEELFSTREMGSFRGRLTLAILGVADPFSLQGTFAVTLPLYAHL